MNDEKRRGRRERTPATPRRRREPATDAGEAKLPVDDVTLPKPQPHDVHDAPRPVPARRPPIIHERRPAPRVPDEDECEPREPE